MRLVPCHHREEWLSLLKRCIDVWHADQTEATSLVQQHAGLHPALVGHVLFHATNWVLAWVGKVEYE